MRQQLPSTIASTGKRRGKGPRTRRQASEQRRRLATDAGLFTLDTGLRPWTRRAKRLNRAAARREQRAAAVRGFTS